MMWRGISIAKLGQLILAPLLVEAMSTLVLAWMFLRAVDLGVPPRQQMLIAAVGSVGYACSSFLAGRWVTPRFAPWLLVGAILSSMGLGLTAIAVDRFWVFVVIALLNGMVIGHYYVPFMINMGHVRPFKTTAFSVALFNVSWGLGASLGPFISAMFKQYGAAVIATLAIVLAGIHTIVSLVAQYSPRVNHDDQTHSAFASTQLQRVSSRACFFLAAIVIRGLYSTLWPYLCAARGWSEQVTAIGWFALYINVPIWALVLAHLRLRLRGPNFMLGAISIGAIAFGLIGIVPLPWMAIACNFAVGIMEGVVVFHALYYANTDPLRPGRSIAWVETLTGIAFVLGPTSFGLLAFDTHGAMQLRTYLPGSAMLMVAVVVTLIIWRRKVHAQLPR